MRDGPIEFLGRLARLADELHVRRQLDCPADRGAFRAFPTIQYQDFTGLEGDDRHFDLGRRPESHAADAIDAPLQQNANLYLKAIVGADAGDRFRLGSLAALDDVDAARDRRIAARREDEQRPFVLPGLTQPRVEGLRRP